MCVALMQKEVVAEKRSPEVEQANPQGGRGAGRERYYVVALSFSSISSDIPLSHGSLASEWV